MAILGTIQKQPAEVIDFDIDCADYFGGVDSSDTINTITAVVSSGSGLTLGPGSLPETALVGTQRGKVWIGAGTTGTTYKVTVTMTSVAGRVREYDVRVIVKEI